MYVQRTRYEFPAEKPGTLCAACASTDSMNVWLQQCFYILFTYFKIMYMFTVQFSFLFITPFYPLSPYSNLKEKKHFSGFPHDFMPTLR
jgi:hypothetical protein